MDRTRVHPQRILELQNRTHRHAFHPWPRSQAHSQARSRTQGTVGCGGSRNSPVARLSDTWGTTWVSPKEQPTLKWAELVRGEEEHALFKLSNEMRRLL